MGRGSTARLREGNQAGVIWWGGMVTWCLCRCSCFSCTLHTQNSGALTAATPTTVTYLLHWTTLGIGSHAAPEGHRSGWKKVDFVSLVSVLSRRLGLRGAYSVCVQVPGWAAVLVGLH